MRHKQNLFVRQGVLFVIAVISVLSGVTAEHHAFACDMLLFWMEVRGLLYVAYKLKFILLSVGA